MLLPDPEQRPIDREELARLYSQMYLIRRVEELAARAYTQRKILGFCHLYIGQESVAVGVAGACRSSDRWITGYREHGQAVAKGVSARKMMAELYGKATGASHGLGGSMHIFDSSVHFMGGYGIVGAQVPIATGVGWALKRLGTQDVCVCFFGDGATHQGAFFEGLCLAELYKLPVVFIIENNFYAMGTSLERQSALTDLSQRAAGVGMAHEQFEGFDVEHVRARTGAALAHARSGKGPVLLEIVTYRYRGHSMSDPARYRPAGELEEKKKSDPLHITETRLRDDFGMTEADLEAIRALADAEAEDAAAFAESSPEPSVEHLYDYTYVPSR